MEADVNRKGEDKQLREREKQRAEEEAERKADEEKRKRIEKLHPTERLKAGTVFFDRLNDGSKGPEMVVIPAGMFRMGDFTVTVINLSDQAILYDCVSRLLWVGTK